MKRNILLCSKKSKVVKKKQKMEIPKKIIDKWRLLRTHGDAKKIAEAANVSRVTIQNVYTSGETNDEVFKAMSDFYQKRIELIKEAI